MATFKATKTLRDERFLADSLGYPKSWHVVRVVDSSGGESTFLDTIYSGPPDANSDTYYNHLAAMDAAMKWTEGESTNYDDNGGQMLPIQTEELGIGDEVEVYYEPEAAYFAAVVKKVVHYKDDVRYTVKYKVDRSTQTNVCIDSIRLIQSKKKTKKAKAIKGSYDVGDGESKANTSTKKEKSTTEISSSSKKKQKKTATTTTSSTFQPDPAALQVAADMGLPEGWSATVAPKSRFTFRSPDGKQKFHSKKTLYAHLGLSASPQKNEPTKKTGGRKKKKGGR